MISQRQGGFFNLYAIMTGILTAVLLPLYEAALPFVPEIVLLDNVSLAPYMIVAFLGVLSGSRYSLRGNEGIGGLSNGARVAARQVLCVAGFVFALVFISKDYHMSRLFLGTYMVILFVVLTFWHAYIPGRLIDMLFPGDKSIPTLLVGSDREMRRLRDWIQARAHFGMPTVGYLSEDDEEKEALPIPRLGKPQELGRLLNERRIRQVVLLDWQYDPATVESMIDQCEMAGCRFLIYNAYGESFSRRFIPVVHGGHHFLALQEEPLEDPLARILKRLLDIAIALPVVVLVLPFLCLWVWVMQRIQAPGPLFFIKPRGGMNSKEFNMLKFRSMKAEQQTDDNLAVQATRNDSRIYSFGRFLRKTSLDEFPQFINVLRGEMSIVGPRPHLVQHDQEFSSINHSYRVRSFVKPGLTGLAQVNGLRGEITDPEKLNQRVYWDLYYVSNWSIFLDIVIILKTAKQVVFPPKTAY